METQSGNIAIQNATLSSGQRDVDHELVENISALTVSGQRGMVLNLVADLHPADLAEVLEHLPSDEANLLFRWLAPEIGGEVLTNLEDNFRASLLEEARTERIAALIDSMDTDDAADVIADLPEEVAQAIIPRLEDAAEVKDLLAFDEDCAGGIMGKEFVAVDQDMTVAQVTDAVRENAEEVEPIYSVFVHDGSGRYIGAVSLKRLLLSRSGVRIADAIDTDPTSVTVDVDQEDVARIMERYDLVSLPVVDKREKVIGRITIDDIVDVIRDEAEEDIQRMSGVTQGEEATDSIFQITRGRLPWLIAGLFGAGMSALVIGMFKTALEEAVVLAFFIPIVMATAGNAGIQSSAIAVQGLASGDVWSTDLWRRLGRELAVSVINGLALALLLGLGVLALVRSEGTASLAMTASLALILVIILATTIGATVPLLLHRFGVDPAIATGPFITTTNDILGILVFFVLATVIYLA